MINCTVLNITQIIVILILLTVLLIQNCGKKRRNKLLKGIDMTILEISIPGCESFCFYIHPVSMSLQAITTQSIPRRIR